MGIHFSFYCFPTVGFCRLFKMGEFKHRSIWPRCSEAEKEGLRPVCSGHIYIYIIKVLYNNPPKIFMTFSMEHVNMMSFYFSVLIFLKSFSHYKEKLDSTKKKNEEEKRDIISITYAINCFLKLS